MIRKQLLTGMALTLALFACTTTQELNRPDFQSQNVINRAVIHNPQITDSSIKADLRFIAQQLKGKNFSELKQPLVFKSQSGFDIKQVVGDCCHDESSQRPDAPTVILDEDFGTITDASWGDDPVNSNGWNQWNGDYYPEGKGVVLYNPGPGNGNRNDPGEYQEERPDLLQTGLFKTISLVDSEGKATYSAGDKLIVKLMVAPTFTHEDSDTAMYVKFNDSDATVAVSNILRGAGTKWQEMHIEVEIPECATEMTLNLLAYLGQNETSSITFETLTVEQVPAEYYSQSQLYFQGFEGGGITTNFGPNSPDVDEEFGRDFYVVSGVTGATHSGGGDRAVTVQNSGNPESGLVKSIDLPAFNSGDSITVEMFSAATFNEAESESLVSLEFFDSSDQLISSVSSSKVNRKNYRWLIIDRALIPAGATKLKVVPKVLLPNTAETGSLLMDDLKVSLNSASGATPPGPVVCATPTPEPTPTPTPEPTATPPVLTPQQTQIALGARLFFEPRLSGNNQMSCATCHDPSKGFSNGTAFATGITGDVGGRNTPTIYEAHAQTLTFWDGRAADLEEQALGPIENPIEMNETLENVITKLSADPVYVNAFAQAYNSAPNSTDLARAIASFEREIRVTNTPDQRFVNGDQAALNASQLRGRNLFFSQRTACVSCHNGASFSDQRFHNIGVNPNVDLGRFNVTGDNRDRNRFKTPTLINVEKTAPYMHDGSLPDLAAVVAHYNQGGTPNNPGQARQVRPLGLNAQEQADLVAFLEALSGDDNLQDLTDLANLLE